MPKALSGQEGPCCKGVNSCSFLLQDSRLNYIEQHAERIGLDSDKLESLRVSASKASPMGDTLDLCARYADSKTLEEMVRSKLRLTQPQSSKLIVQSHSLSLSKTCC